MVFLIRKLLRFLLNNPTFPALFYEYHIPVPSGHLRQLRIADDISPVLRPEAYGFRLLILKIINTQLIVDPVSLPLIGVKITFLPIRPCRNLRRLLCGIRIPVPVAKVVIIAGQESPLGIAGCTADISPYLFRRVPQQGFYRLCFMNPVLRDGTELVGLQCRRIIFHHIVDLHLCHCISDLEIRGPGKGRSAKLIRQGLSVPGRLSPGTLRRSRFGLSFCPFRTLSCRILCTASRTCPLSVIRNIFRSL